MKAKESPREKDGRLKYWYQLCCIHGGVVAVLHTSRGPEFVIERGSQSTFDRLWIQRSDQPAVKGRIPQVMERTK